MFDIGFSELLLVLVIGLIVLGPKRLPIAVKTVAGWLRAIRSLANSIQTELNQEVQLQVFQDSLEKVDKTSLHHISPELKASMDELREVTTSIPYAGKAYISECDSVVGDSATRQTEVAPTMAANQVAEQTERSQSNDTVNVKPASAKPHLAAMNCDNTKYE